MTQAVARILEEVEHLSEVERRELRHAIVERIPMSDAEEGVEQAWAIEVGRRLERVHQGTAKGRPAEEVFRDIRARHQR